jgi:hypothetical protein
MVEQVVLAGVKKLAHFSFDYLRTGCFGPIKTRGQPDEMRVNGQTGNVEGFTQDHIGSFAPHPREFDQLFYSAGDFTGIFAAQSRSEAQKRISLVVEESGGTDQLLQLGAFCLGKIFCRWVAGKELRGD